MKLILSLSGLMIFIAACHDIQGNVSSPSAKARTENDSVNNRHIDSTIKVARHPNTGDEDPTPKLSDIYNDWIEGYKKAVVIDTAFVLGGDVFEMHVKHYCLLDSGVVVPHKYVEMYKLDSFVTHNFATFIKLDKNSKTILQKTVYKKDFEKLLYPEEKKYGVLLSPDLSLENDAIEVHYSISIPLTDVGVGVAMKIGSDGKVAYRGQ